MLMDREKYDQLIQELSSEGLNGGRKVIILDEIRMDYNRMLDHMEELSTANAALQVETDELAKVNVKLFKDVGREVYGVKGVETPKVKTFSEAVTLESIEKANK